MKLVFATILICLATIFSVAQDDHTTNSEERFANMRILPPVKVLDWNGRHIEYSFIDKVGIHFGHFDVDKDTSLDDTFIKEWKRGMWWMLYCVQDRHLYLIQRVRDGQIK